MCRREELICSGITALPGFKDNVIRQIAYYPGRNDLRCVYDMAIWLFELGSSCVLWCLINLTERCKGCYYFSLGFGVFASWCLCVFIRIIGLFMQKRVPS